MKLIQKQKEVIYFDELSEGEYFGYVGSREVVFVKIKLFAILPKEGDKDRIPNAFNLTINENVSFRNKDSVYRLKNSEIEMKD